MNIGNKHHTCSTRSVKSWRIWQLLKVVALIYYGCHLAGCASTTTTTTPIETVTHTKESDTDKEGIPETLASWSAEINLSLAELIATDSASYELRRFRTGDHDDQPRIYGPDSEGLKELLDADYYRTLIDICIADMAAWYGGHIPDNDGLFSQAKPYRVFSPADALIGFLDGIDMADVIGTMTFHLRLATQDGQIHFLAINHMSLESYSGSHYLQHQWVNNPITGPFRTVTQVFRWQEPIPQQWRLTTP